jgi:lysophospholipase L1-like esterase
LKGQKIMWNKLIVGAVTLLAAGCVSNGHGDRTGSPAYWAQSFELSPADVKPSEELLKKYPQLRNLPSFTGTMRYRFALSVGGQALRVQLSNDASDKPLRIAAASVARAADEMDADPATIRRLTFAGQEGIEIPVNATVLSDAVDLNAAELTELVVSLYFAEGYPASPLGGAALIGAHEDAVMSATMKDAWRIRGRPVISGVLVARDKPTHVIAAFGDSITDGARSKPAEPHGWADALARRLAQRPGGLALGVISAGIGGNRILSPGTGPSALARADRDVFAVPGLKYVIVLEGINDIGNSDKPPAPQDTSPLNAEALIAGLAQIAARAHVRGVKVYAGTILPFRGAGYFSDDKEKIRLAANAWIRRSSAYDGVIDFENAVKDPARPDALSPSYDSGDHLHPSEAGYKAMAEAIPLDLFN